MRRASTGAVIGLSLVFCSLSFAASTIQGKVVDNSGQPIEGARVWFAGSNTKTCTNKLGQYSLPSRNKFIYTIRALKSKHSEAQSTVVAGKGPRNSDMVLNRNTSKIYSDCRIRALRQSKPFWHDDDEQPPTRLTLLISGIVIDGETGQPLSGVTLTTQPATVTTTTDSLGTYTIYHQVKAGLYQIMATLDGFEQGVARIRVRPTSTSGVSSTKGDIVLNQTGDRHRAQAQESSSEGHSHIENFEGRIHNEIDSAEGGSSLDDE